MYVTIYSCCYFSYTIAIFENFCKHTDAHPKDLLGLTKKAKSLSVDTRQLALIRFILV